MDDKACEYFVISCVLRMRVWLEASAGFVYKL